MCGNMGNGGGASGGTSANSQTNDYNIYGDYTKIIDTKEFVSDVGELPPLQGSVRQVEWAESIRNDIFNKLDKAVLYDVDQYNHMVNQRADAIERGGDVSGWGRITPNDYDNAIAKARSRYPAANIAKKAYSEFFREHTRAGDIIDYRQALPGGETMINSFMRAAEKAKSQGKQLTVEDGVKYIKAKLAREGYKT